MLGEIAHSFCAYRCNFPPLYLCVCLFLKLTCPSSSASSPVPLPTIRTQLRKLESVLSFSEGAEHLQGFFYGSVILFFMGLHEDKNTDWQSTLTKKNMRLVVHATQHIWAWHCRGPSNWLSPSTAPSQETKAVFFIAGGYWLAQGKYQAQEWLLHWLSKESFINSKPVT